MGISVIMPAYNEAENLTLLLGKIKNVLAETESEYEIIVIDAARSTDNALEVCLKNNVKYIRQSGMGYADAIRTGIEHARMPALLVLDCDGSQDIEKIPEMYGKFLCGYDVVIGSRYISGGSTDEPVISVLMSRLLNTAFRCVLGFKEKDISTDFRIYRTALLRAIQTTSVNFDVIEETLMLLYLKNPLLTTFEIPIHYRQRLCGTSKRRLAAFIAGYIRLLCRLAVLRKKEAGKL